MEKLDGNNFTSNNFFELVIKSSKSSGNSIFSNLDNPDNLKSLFSLLKYMEELSSDTMDSRLAEYTTLFYAQMSSLTTLDLSGIPIDKHIENISNRF